MQTFTIKLFLVLLLLGLAGCSVSVKKDGPPDHYVDVSKIPDAVPKVEPFSHYGNPTYYTALGHRYYVLHDNLHFKERGTASWYGTKFHAVRTSSGEPYNMYAMTGAHRTLPLPTYVRVRNLKNNRQIIVKINDRGPFASNRIIDLSYVAARKLDVVRYGTANVEIEAIDPRHMYANNTQTATPTRHASVFRHTTATPSTTPAGAHWYLQAGAFGELAYAKRLQQRLHQVTPAPIQIRRVAQGKIHYVVRIGPLASAANSAQLSHTLTQFGFSKPLSMYL